MCTQAVDPLLLSANKFRSHVLGGGGGGYVTAPRDLEFCMNVRQPCDTSPNKQEVRSRMTIEPNGSYHVPSISMGCIYCERMRFIMTIVYVMPNKQSTIARHFVVILWPLLAQIIPYIHADVSEHCFGADLQSF